MTRSASDISFVLEFTLKVFYLILTVKAFWIQIFLKIGFTATVHNFCCNSKKIRQLKRKIIVTCWKILRKGRKAHNRGNSIKENLNISAKRQNLETFRIDLDKKKLIFLLLLLFERKKDVAILETINYVSVYNEGSTIKVNQYENVNLFNLFWTCIR